jgi:hypothetical protein
MAYVSVTPTLHIDTGVPFDAETFTGSNGAVEDVAAQVANHVRSGGGRPRRDGGFGAGGPRRRPRLSPGPSPVGDRGWVVPCNNRDPVAVIRLIRPS